MKITTTFFLLITCTCINAQYGKIESDYKLAYESELVSNSFKYYNKYKIVGNKGDLKVFKYNVNYRVTDETKILLPLYTKRRNFKLMSNISFGYNYLELDEFKSELDELTKLNLKDGGGLGAQKLLLSLNSIYIFKIYEKTFVLNSNVSHFSYGDFENSFYSISSNLIYPWISNEKEKLNVGLYISRNYLDKYIAFPIVSYSRLLPSDYVLTAIVPYKIDITKYFGKNYSVSLGTILGATNPLSNIRDVSPMLEDDQVLLREVSVENYAKFRARLWKNLMFSVEGGIKSVFTSEFVDSDKNTVLENDSYSAFYVGGRLSWSILTIKKSKRKHQ